jgi:acrylyl-CoA reductase (NADPH)
MGYKDGLIITGKGHRQLVQTFPFVPGVDLAGVVEKSSSTAFRAGQEVVVTGWGLGERHWGGYAEKARVKSEWVIPLPAGMTMRQAMTYGSAGLSAMLCVNALEKHGIGTDREILVTGSTGGVGSVAVNILHRLGYKVAASTSRPSEADYLRSLGADLLVDAKQFAQKPERPLLAERWGGAVDNVGGTTLSSILASTSYGGAVASLGLVGGTELQTSILPFIKRNVALIGVDSELCPNSLRSEAWKRLVDVIPEGLSDAVVQEVSLNALPERAAAILRGEVRGRTLVVL